MGVDVGRRGYRFEMNLLYKQATLQGIFGAFLFIALIFWPAGTFHYRQGWVFLATFRRLYRRLHRLSRDLRQTLARAPVERGAAARKGAVAETHRLTRIRVVFCVDNFARA